MKIVFLLPFFSLLEAIWDLNLGFVFNDFAQTFFSLTWQLNEKKCFILHLSFCIGDF